MDIINQGTQLYGLILARIMGLMFTAPIFSAASISTTSRMGLGLMVSAVLYSSTASYLMPLPGSTGGFMLAIADQALIGVLIGYMMTVIFSAFQVAGEIFSIQVGLSFSEVLDPQSQVSAPIIGTLKNTIGLLLFIAVDFQMDGEVTTAMLHSVRALAYSFQMAPMLVLDTTTTGGILSYLDQTMGAMFVTALKIGIPVMGILFITSVTMGLMGRAAPQMNLMNMGIQVNIIVGLLLLMALYPVIIPLMREALRLMFDRIADMLHHWPTPRMVPIP